MPRPIKKESPLTLNRLVSFYEKAIKPQLDEIPLLRKDLEVFRNEVNQRFDDLYRKYEKLEQEYVVIKHQE